MNAPVSLSAQDFLELKEETLEECSAILVRSCLKLKRERQQAALTSFVGMAIAASAIDCAPNHDEAALFAAHMQDQFAKLVQIYLDKSQNSSNDA